MHISCRSRLSRILFINISYIITMIYLFRQIVFVCLSIQYSLILTVVFCPLYLYQFTIIFVKIWSEQRFIIRLTYLNTVSTAAKICNLFHFTVKLLHSLFFCSMIYSLHMAAKPQQRDNICGLHMKGSNGNGSEKNYAWNRIGVNANQGSPHRRKPYTGRIR